MKKFYNSVKNLISKIGGSAAKKSEQLKLAKEKPVFKKSNKKIPSFSQLRYSGMLLSKKEKRLAGISSVLTVCSLVFLGLVFWQTSLANAPASGGTYTEGAVGTPQRINPLYSSSSDIDQALAKLTFSGLIKISQSNEYEPDLAESWQLSDDEKSYTFKLKEDIHWPDGEPFDADDVIFTIQAIRDQEYLSPLRSIWLPVEIAKIDNFTVEFKLSEPFTPFLENATVGILPEHIWSHIPPLNAPLAEFNLKPVGLGPWQFEQLTKNKQGAVKSYTLVPNESHPNKKPFLDEISFKFYNSIEEAIAALNGNQVEGLAGLPSHQKGNLSNAGDLAIKQLKIPQYTAVFFNQDKNEILSEKAVRVALAWSTNKKQIINEALYGDGRQIDAPILEGFPGYHEDIRKFPFNPDEAQNILEEAGWRLESDTGVRQKDDVPLQFTLTTVNNPTNLKTAEILRQTWQAIGIKVDLKIVESDLIQKEVIKPRNFEAFLFGALVGHDPDPYPFWHSTQIGESGLNLSNFASRDADTVLEVARQLSDPQARAEKYIHFQNILVEQLPAIFLYQPYYNYPLPNKIKGFDLRQISTPAERFIGSENWYIKTKKTLK